MNSTAALGLTPGVEEVHRYLGRKYPFMARTVTRAAASFGADWITEFEDFLVKMFGTDTPALHRAVDGYAIFALDAVRQQKRFDVEGRYRATSYAQTSAKVYENRDYMMSSYLPGILLSHYVWPHHYRHKQFFDQMFAEPLGRAGATDFFDVGVGTGFYSRRLLERVPGVRGVGWDVSEHSRDYALLQVERFGFADRYEVRLQDIVANPPSEQRQWLMSIEVLEHLEDPVAFLRVLRAMLKPGGKAFITAALTAANEDHIFLYRSSEDVHDQLRIAGFALEQAFVGAAYPAGPAATVPTVAAFIVT